MKIVSTETALARLLRPIRLQPRGVFERVLSLAYAPMRMRLSGISTDVSRNAVLLGQLLASDLGRRKIGCLTEAEFKVFSQFGEDGILQYLIASASPLTRVFVEIGVDDYLEANTRFLLLANKWRGLVIEGNSKQVQRIRESDLRWRCDLMAVDAFVTSGNVNSLIEDAGVEGDIGVLSIDIDGNDFWIWKALEVVRPTIVVCEFNRAFGPALAITVPYDPEFSPQASHCLYYGASLRALCMLAEQKGYAFVGCTSEGVNAFFVSKDRQNSLTCLQAADGFAMITAASRRAIDLRSHLSEIGHLPVFDVMSGAIKTLNQCADSVGHKSSPT